MEKKWIYNEVTCAWWKRKETRPPTTRRMSPLFERLVHTLPITILPLSENVFGASKGDVRNYCSQMHAIHLQLHESVLKQQASRMVNCPVVNRSVLFRLYMFVDALNIVTAMLVVICVVQHCPNFQQGRFAYAVPKNTHTLVCSILAGLWTGLVDEHLFSLFMFSYILNLLPVNTSTLRNMRKPAYPLVARLNVRRVLVCVNTSAHPHVGVCNDVTSQ